MATTELSPPKLQRPVGNVRPLPWAAFLAISALILAHLPLLVAHGQQIWLRPHYQFFPLVVVGAIILFVMRTQRLGTLTPAPSWSAAACFLGVWVALVAAEAVRASWFGAVAAVLGICALLFALGGGRLLKAGAPAVALLCVAIPPPFELDRTLILELQSWTARWGSRMLDFLGIYHVLAGHVVEIGGRQYLVEEACSGVNSLFSVLGCTLFFVFLNRRSAWLATVLLGSAVVWVLAANVLRVVAVAYLGTVYELDLGTGWKHEALGFSLFGLALVMVWSSDRFLVFLTAPALKGQPGYAEASPEREPTEWASLPQNLAWPVTLGFALLLAVHFALYGTPAVASGHTEEPAVVQPNVLAEESLPRHFGRWERQHFDITPPRNPGSEYGEFSRVWNYQFGSQTATVSVDYPFPYWHDLTRCYSGQGWLIEEQTTHNPPEEFVEVRLTKPAYRSGYLLFAEVDRLGNTLEPRRGGLYLSLHRHDSALRSLWGKASGETLRTDPPGPIFQVQLFAETHTALSEEGRAEARSLFVQALKRLRGQSTERDALDANNSKGE